MRLTAMVCSLLLLTGCASYGERTLKIRSDFANGNIESAKTQIDKNLKNRFRKKEADLLKLNEAIIELSNGEPKRAEQLLREVRDHFDANEQEQIRKTAEKTVSMLLDDNAVSYAGEDYEKVLIRVFLVLSNLMNGGDDAQAYSLQINAKQADIIEKQKRKTAEISKADFTAVELPNYKQVAIGAYLSGILQEETFRNADDVQKAYQAVCAWEPNFQQGKRDLERAMHGKPYQQGCGAVYVIGLVGSGPMKVQQNCEVLQAAQLMTTMMISMFASRPVVPDLAPVMIPCVVQPRETVSALAVSVDSKTVTYTETIMNIGRMAEEQFEAIKPQIIARAVVRRAMKKAIVYGVQEGTDSNPWIGLAMQLGGIIWEATETADTRCWNLLPEKIQVARLDVPAGEHRLCIQQRNNIDMNVQRIYLKEAASVCEQTICVEAGRNTYVLANFPNGELTGKISVSTKP